MIDSVLLRDSISKGMSITEIGNYHHVSRPTVRKYIKKYNLNSLFLNEDVKTLRETRRKNYHSHSIKWDWDRSSLQKIDTEEKAYVIGFLFADGWVGGDARSVHVRIKEKDMLEFYPILCKAVGANSLPLRTYQRPLGISDMSQCSLYSTTLVQSLGSYGILKNKTKESTGLLLPPQTPKKLITACLRGWFDGDGYMGAQPILACSNLQQGYSFITLARLLFPTLDVKFIERDNSVSLRFLRQSKPLWELLYDSNRVGLSRKYNSYRNTW